MNAVEIEEVLVSQYINDKCSGFLRIRLNDGNIFSGRFIKKNQLPLNKTRNKWVLTTTEKDILVDGRYIIEIYLLGKLQ